ncbi:hypothetical protein SAMN04244548_04933 [Paracoccus pantotrophus]|nr:hypothetical protein SAMN04244548_04933 [Paracoccus pantotrophus]
MTITPTSIEALRSALSSLPPKAKSKLTARDVVATLASEIHAKISQDGYSLKDMAAEMSERGVRISASTLGTYLRSLAHEKEVGTSAARARVRRKAPAQH